MAMNALRRFNPYPAYKDSGVEWLGKVPAHWEVKRLRFVSESNPVPSEVRGLPPTTEVSFVPMEAVGEYGGLSLETTKQLADVKAGYTYFRDGDIVIAKITPCFENGKGALATHLTNGIAFGTTELHVLRPGITVDRRFMFYVTLSDAFRRLGEADMYGAGGQKRISESFVRNFPSTLPPEPEQRAIAAYLDRETTRIDALVAKKERLIELLQEKRTALMTHAIAAGLSTNQYGVRSPSVVFPLIPAGSELRKLRRILTRVSRPVDVDPDAEYQEIGIRSWGRGIFHKDPLRGALLEEKSVFRIEPGDFVLNIVFAWEGAVAIVTEAERGMIGSHRFPTFRASSEVDLDYLLMVLQTQQGRWLMEVNSPGAAGRNKTIRLSQFLDEEIPLPILPVQRKVVQAFRANEHRFEDLIRRLEDAIATLKELRIGLISAAVTGKIDVSSEAA